MSESSAAQAQRNPRRGRAVDVALWILQVLLALAFAFAGLSKLFGQTAMVEMFQTIGIGQWFRFVVGTLEVAGAVGLLIPRLCGLAALGLICVMVGAILAHIFILGPGVMLPVIYVLLCAIVVWGRWDRVRGFVALARR